MESRLKSLEADVKGIKARLLGKSPDPPVAIFELKEIIKQEARRNKPFRETLRASKCLNTLKDTFCQLCAIAQQTECYNEVLDLHRRKGFPYKRAQLSRFHPQELLRLAMLCGFVPKIRKAANSKKLREFILQAQTNRKLVQRIKTISE